MDELSTYLTALAFFVAALVIRIMLQHSVESRYQMIGFTFLAGAREGVRYGRSGYISGSEWVLNASCAIGAVLIAKFVIEYTPLGMRRIRSKLTN